MKGDAEYETSTLIVGGGLCGVRLAMLLEQHR